MTNKERYRQTERQKIDKHTIRIYLYQITILQKGKTTLHLKTVKVKDGPKTKQVLVIFSNILNLGQNRKSFTPVND